MARFECGRRYGAALLNSQNAAQEPTTKV